MDVCIQSLHATEGQNEETKNLNTQILSQNIEGSNGRVGMGMHGVRRSWKDDELFCKRQQKEVHHRVELITPRPTNAAIVTKDAAPEPLGQGSRAHR